MLTTTHPVTYRKPGRPMKIGKLVFDKDNIHNVGIFVGNCHNCNDKVIISQAEAEEFAKTYWNDKNSLTRRLLRYITRNRSI